jgi:hypothetical protein
MGPHLKSRPDPDILMEHDLFEKPDCTFPDHAQADISIGAIRRYIR